jgi:hypothetical protein
LKSWLIDEKHTLNIRKESNSDKQSFEDHNEALAESVFGFEDYQFTQRGPL